MIGWSLGLSQCLVLINFNTLSFDFTNMTVTFDIDITYDWVSRDNKMNELMKFPLRIAESGIPAICKIK